MDFPKQEFAGEELIDVEEPEEEEEMIDLEETLDEE